MYEIAINSAPNHRKGTKVSAETIKKMSEAQKLRTQLKGASNKNTCWLNNGETETMVKQSDIENYLLNGWVKGRLYKHSQETIKKIQLKASGQVRNKDFCEKMRQIALKQLPRTENQRKEQSLKLKLYYQTHPNPFLNKKHTEESKQKMRESVSIRYKCPYCDYVSTKSWVSKHIIKNHSEHTPNPSVYELA